MKMLERMGVAEIRSSYGIAEAIIVCGIPSESPYSSDPDVVRKRVAGLYTTIAQLVGAAV